MNGSPISNGCVLIEDNKIAYVGKEDQPAEQVIDARGCIVMPGLINAHTHGAMTLFRGYCDDTSLKQWLEDNMWPIEAQLTDNDIYTGTMLACLEMIRSGTTAFADMYFHMDKAAEAVDESGLRAALSYGMIELGDEDKGKKELSEGRRFVRKWNGAAQGRITTMYGPHAPDTCSKAFLGNVKKNALEDNVRIHIHVLETEAELNKMKEQYGMCSVNMLDELGFLGPDVLAAHTIWLSPGDMDILARKGVSAVHCPVSNMKLASGIAPVPELLSRDVNVALGTDGTASNNSLDMFEEMKTAALLHKVNSMDPTALPVNEVLKMATYNGAKALGISAGMLKVGMAADIIIVDMNKPHLVPVHNQMSHLVYAAKGSDVRTTIVDGHILMEDGKVLSMDQNRVMEQAAYAAKRLADSVEK